MVLGSYHMGFLCGMVIFYGKEGDGVEEPVCCF